MFWYFVIVVLILGIILGLYARFVGAKGLIIKEYLVESDIPKNFDGLKIVHISDLHYGRTTLEKEMKNLVNKVNMLNPDIVVLTGDTLDEHLEASAEDKNVIIKYLNMIEAKLGKYMVSGNHDLDKKYFGDITTDGGFKFLENNYELIYFEGYEPIVIAGVSSAFDEVNINDKLSDYGKFIEENDAKYKILLTHEPDVVLELKYDFDLILAGHSHNGQIRLPLVGAVVLPDKSRKYYDEHYEVNGAELFISSGVGTSGVPLRLLNKPSINFYRIVNKTS